MIPKQKHWTAVQHLQQLQQSSSLTTAHAGLKGRAFPDRWLRKTKTLGTRGASSQHWWNLGKGPQRRLRKEGGTVTSLPIFLPSLDASRNRSTPPNGRSTGNPYALPLKSKTESKTRGRERGLGSLPVWEKWIRDKRTPKDVCGKAWVSCIIY